jgi:hypothetical protein
MLAKEAAALGRKCTAAAEGRTGGNITATAMPPNESSQAGDGLPQLCSAAAAETARSGDLMNPHKKP